MPPRPFQDLNDADLKHRVSQLWNDWDSTTPSWWGDARERIAASRGGWKTSGPVNSSDVERAILLEAALRWVGI